MAQLPRFVEFLGAVLSGHPAGADHPRQNAKPVHGARPIPHSGIDPFYTFFQLKLEIGVFQSIGIDNLVMDWISFDFFMEKRLKFEEC